MARAAHSDGARRLAAHRDGLVMALEQARPVRRLVAPRVAGQQLLDEEVLGVALRRGEAPADPAIVADDEERHAGRGRADQRQPRRLDAHQVPLRRRLQPEMGIVGEQRLAARGMAAGHHPVVRLAGRAGEEGEVRQRRQLRLRRPGKRGMGGLAGQRRPEQSELVGREHAGDLPAQHLVAPIVAELPGHQPAPDQRVGRAPILRPIAQQGELRRQHARLVEEGVDPGAVSVGDRLQLRRQGPELRFRQVVEAERAHHGIGRHGRRADDLGQPPGAEPARQVHLQQAILGMDETEREIGVVLGGSADGDDAVAIAPDLDRAGQAGDLEGAADLRQRLAQPDEEPEAEEAHQER